MAAVPILRLRDDLGRELTFAGAPRRIVSLVPSDTYSVIAMGLLERLVGRTRYCDLPEALHLPVVGGTKDVDVEAVLALSPDLVIANQEENSRKALEQLAQRGAKVFVSMPRRAADGVVHLARLARVLDVTSARAVVELVRKGYRVLPESSTRPVDSAITPDSTAPPPPPTAVEDHSHLPSAFVPIWLDPLMTCNADTFGSDVLAQCGVRNAFADRLRLYPLAADLGKAEAASASGRDTRYPRVTFDEVRARAPQMILLTDEPYAFSAEDEAKIAAELPGVPIARISGRDLFWYGAWTIEAVPRLREQLAPILATAEK